MTVGPRASTDSKGEGEYEKDADHSTFLNDRQDCRSFWTATTRARWPTYLGMHVYRKSINIKMMNKRKRGTPTLWLIHVLTDSQLDWYQHDKFARWLKHVHFFLSSTFTPTAGRKTKKINQNDNFNEKRAREKEIEVSQGKPLLQPVRERGYHHNGTTKPDNLYRRVDIESQIWDNN